MQTVQDDAYKGSADAHLLETAHAVSAEYHRRRGVFLGTTATALSAIVGTAIFVAAAKLTIGKEGAITIPTDFLGLGLFYVVVVLSVLSPVLSACEKFLNDQAETEKHLASARHYSNVALLLDQFIRTLPNKDQGVAGNELLEILKQKANPQPLPPSLTDKAIRKAKERIADKRVPSEA